MKIGDRLMRWLDFLYILVYAPMTMTLNQRRQTKMSETKYEIIVH
jgi:hypothetical protein